MLILLCGIVGCASMTPGKVAEVSIDSILLLSGEIDMAERRGLISNSTEDEMQNRLIDALKVMEATISYKDVAGCDESLSQQECIQVIMLEIERRLLEVQ